MIFHDPGARAGWARFDTTGRLIQASKTLIRPAPGELVVIEYPESRGGRTKATTDDLIALAYRAGEYAGYARAHGAIVERVKPSEWKGSVPKNIHHRRILAVLDADEIAIVHGATKDVLDAVGLGLWKNRRLGP